MYDCFLILLCYSNHFLFSEALVVHPNAITTKSAVLLSPTAHFKEPHCFEMTYSARFGAKVSFDFFLLFDDDDQGPSKSMGSLYIAADREGSPSFNLNQSGSDLQVKGLLDMPAGTYRLTIRLGGDYLQYIAIHRIQLSHGKCREPGRFVCTRANFAWLILIVKERHTFISWLFLLTHWSCLVIVWIPITDF